MSKTVPPIDDDGETGRGAAEPRDEAGQKEDSAPVRVEESDRVSSPKPSSRKGEQVGKYRLGECLGEGGMAVVYEAVRTDHLKNRVAIKLMHPSLARIPEYVARFEREAEILSKLDDPGIVRVMDFGIFQHGECYLVMELLSGESLAGRLSRQPLHRLDWEVAVQFGHQIASALAYAHKQGVVHRDLKPDNVMVVTDSAVVLGERIKLVDFGIARQIEESGRPLTVEGGSIGTPRYMSPEQLKGIPVTPVSDVFSLALVLFESIVGRSPFEQSGFVAPEHIVFGVPLSLHAVREDVPRAIGDLLRRMLSKVPTERPSMAEVASELERNLPSIPSLEKPLTGHRKGTSRLSGGVPTQVYVAGGVALGVLLLATIAALVWNVLPRFWGLRSDRVPVPSSMVRIPAGSFPMGTRADDVRGVYDQCVKEFSSSARDCALSMFEREVPQQTVRMSEFLVDKEPIKIREFLRFLEANSSRIRVEEDSDTKQPRFVTLGDGKKLLDLPGSHIVYDKAHGTFSVEAAYENRPVEQISWRAANLYCQGLGKVLISEAQWEYVAYLLQSQDASVSKIPDSHGLAWSVGSYEWVFDQFSEGKYLLCKDCEDWRFGSPLSERSDNDSCVTRGCKPERDRGVHCRRTKRTFHNCSVGSQYTTFRCVRLLSGS